MSAADLHQKCNGSRLFFILKFPNYMHTNSIKKIALLVFSIVLLFCFQNCKHENIEAPSNKQDTTTNKDTTHQTTKPDSVCFNTSIYPLIMSNCGMSGCHDAASHAKGLDVTTYAKISYYATQIYSSINANRMPQGLPKFTADQKALFLKWMNEGKKNTYCNNNCDTSSVTYTKSIAPVVSKYCLGCHNTNNAASSGGNVFLDNYTNVKTNAVSGNLLCSIDWSKTCSKMPKGNTPLAYCDIRKFVIWKKNNCPQ